MAAVRRYDVLDTPPDGAFDRITAMAARRFGVPISIISIVDTDRIWFKSRHGVTVDQIDRLPGLCASAILSPDPHILVDAGADPRSLANPLVAGDFGLRFYAGMPLRTQDGHNLGTLCVIDREPRPVTPDEIADLKDMAAIVIDQLELRLSARRAIADAEVMAREIDHRVTNSLQFIAGLLAMQARTASPGDTAGQLAMASMRVEAVARVHRHCYLGQVDQSVSCRTYIERLCSDLSGILETPIEVEGDDEAIVIARVQPIGLIVNELVTNAAKHGGGGIHVSYRIEGDRRHLAVCDEGRGLASDFDPGTAGTGLGMKVVCSLARQMRGELRASNNATGRGACFAVDIAA